MDAISNQRLSGMLARSFSSLPSNQASEGERAQRGQAARRPHGEHHRCDKPKEASGQEGEATAKLDYRRSAGTSLFITTQEGDTVELKISVRQSTSLAATQSQDGEQTTTAVEKSSKLSARVSFEVEGDLNDEEMAAIASVMKQAGELAQQFFDDDVAGAFDAAAALKIDASQLASVGLSLQLREQMTYTAKGLPANVIALPTAAPAPTTNAGTTPATAPSTPAAAATTTPAAPTPESTTEVTPAATPSAAASAAAADTAPAASTQSAPDTIRKFLTQLMQALSAPAPGAASGASLELSLKLRIFQSVVTQTAATKAADTGTEPALPPLVPETLDTLAARQEAPLQAVA